MPGRNRKIIRVFGCDGKRLPRVSAVRAKSLIDRDLAYLDGSVLRMNAPDRGMRHNEDAAAIEAKAICDRNVEPGILRAVGTFIRQRRSYLLG